MSAQPAIAKVAIITGAASGIGAETARVLAARGWRVVINYRTSVEAANKVVAECKTLAAEKGGDAIAVQADVSDDEACKSLVADTLKAYGRIDALMNNAGETKAAPAADLDALSGDDFMRLYRNNVVSVYQMTRAAAPALKASGQGSVVNIGSRAGVTGDQLHHTDRYSQGMCRHLHKHSMRSLTYICAPMIQNRFLNMRRATQFNGRLTPFWKPK